MTGSTLCECTEWCRLLKGKGKVTPLQAQLWPRGG